VGSLLKRSCDVRAFLSDARDLNNPFHKRCRPRFVAATKRIALDLPDDRRMDIGNSRPEAVGREWRLFE